MRIVVDLDGTICEIREGNQQYSDVEPIPGAIESLKLLKKAGHDIIIYTARNMKTYNGNTGKVIANIGLITLCWLEKYKVPYDEIVFGKPQGDLYIDDLAIPFENWKDVLDKVCERTT